MIKATDLSKRYKTVQALDGVSFHAERGETLGVIGPNGAGKTTLIKILLGLVRPDAGKVTLGGLDLVQHPTAARRLVGYVPQRDGFESGATGRESLSFLARLRGVDKGVIQVHCQRVGVAELLDRPVGTLSGGQRQRLSLAASLLGDPPILLLDEPTASLDPRANAEFRSLVTELASEGRTILLCSHLLADVERVCHRVLVLLDGRVETTREPAGENLEARFLRHLGAPNLEIVP